MCQRKLQGEPVVVLVTVGRRRAARGACDALAGAVAGVALVLGDRRAVHGPAAFLGSRLDVVGLLQGVFAVHHASLLLVGDLRFRRYPRGARLTGPRRSEEDALMATEIERKFLLRELPADAAARPHARRSRQGYLALDGDTEVRVRTGSHDAAADDQVRPRRECARRVEARHSTARGPDGAVEAHRGTAHRRRPAAELRVDGVEAEVDEYEGDLKGLVVVEVEFPGEEGVAGVRNRPPWFGRELTGDRRVREPQPRLRRPPAGLTVRWLLCPHGRDAREREHRDRGAARRRVGDRPGHRDGAGVAEGTRHDDGARARRAGSPAPVRDDDGHEAQGLLRSRALRVRLPARAALDAGAR